MIVNVKYILNHLFFDFLSMLNPFHFYILGSMLNENAAKKQGSACFSRTAATNPGKNTNKPSRNFFTFKMTSIRRKKTTQLYHLNAEEPTAQLLRMPVSIQIGIIGERDQIRRMVEEICGGIRSRSRSNEKAAQNKKLWIGGMNAEGRDG